MEILVSLAPSFLVKSERAYATYVVHDREQRATGVIHSKQEVSMPCGTSRIKPDVVVE
jgi:hypothetical protein